MRWKSPNVALAFIVSTIVLIAASACASGGSSGPRRDPNLITAEEMSQFSALTALDVIRRLRPRWLRSRGQSNPQIIQDGARMGTSTENLRTLSVSDIESMRFLSASDATMRYGTNFPGGAIEITSRAR